MNRLTQLFEDGRTVPVARQSAPWVDHLGRAAPSASRTACEGSPPIRRSSRRRCRPGDAYDDQLRAAGRPAGWAIEDTYWSLVTRDIEDALAILRPVYDESDALDGYVSVEVDPGSGARHRRHVCRGPRAPPRIDEPNLYVKIPGTVEGLPAVQQMIAEGRNINVTLIFSLERYERVIDAYIAGLEACPGDLSHVSSVASFFVSRVDNEVDRRLEAIGTPEALALRGKVAVANAQVAYQLFLERFSGPRWETLVDRGARVQRPLWASTSTKNPDYPDTLYVDELIGPDTVNTLPDATLDAFEDHGAVARTLDADPAGARAVLDRPGPGGRRPRTM